MVWEELVKDRLRVQANVAGKGFARTFASLEALDECASPLIAFSFH